MNDEYTMPQHIRQNAQEFEEFVAFLKAKNIRSFLEIGSQFGACLWAIAQRAMAQRSRIVSVELPNGEWGRSDSELSLRECFAHLKRQGHDVHLFIGDSTDTRIVKAVTELAPFDAIFIDANHTEPFVRKDFANYGKLTPIVCFHDVGWNQPVPPGRNAIDVHKVWRELKQQLKDQATFTDIRREQQTNGIGILEWRE